MRNCLGDIPVSAKVDRQMLNFLDSEAERIGVTRAELQRRMFSLYLMSRHGETECPHCDETIKMDVRES